MFKISIVSFELSQFSIERILLAFGGNIRSFDEELIIDLQSCLRD